MLYLLGSQVHLGLLRADPGVLDDLSSQVHLGLLDVEARMLGSDLERQVVQPLELGGRVGPRRGLVGRLELPDHLVVTIGGDLRCTCRGVGHCDLVALIEGKHEANSDHDGQSSSREAESLAGSADAGCGTRLGSTSRHVSPFLWSGTLCPPLAERSSGRGA